MANQDASPRHYLDSQIDLESAEIVAAYDEVPLWSAIFGLLLLEHVPLGRYRRVLDVGCGTGFPLLELAQRLGPACTVVGLDIWEAALERARFKARVWRLTNVELRRGDAGAMPFGDAEFDLIVSNLGVNNFADPDAALRECGRVMKSGAKLALTTNLRGHMHEFYAVYDAVLRRLGRGDAVESLRSHIDHRVSAESLRALLTRAGFRVTKLVEDSATMRFASGSALFRDHFIQLGFLDAWKGVVGPADQKEIFSRLEDELNTLAESHGELGLTIPMAYVEAKKIQQDARVP